MYYAAAKDGNLPQVFSMINITYYSPIVSIVLMTSTSVFALFLEDLSLLILFGTFSEFFFIGVAISAIIYLRLKKPNLPRPIKVPLFYPIFFTIICIFMVELTIYQYTYETMIGLVLLIAGIPVYILVKIKPNKKNSNLLSRFMSK
jgi:amino acid transporter